MTAAEETTAGVPDERRGALVFDAETSFVGVLMDVIPKFADPGKPRGENGALSVPDAVAAELADVLDVVDVGAHVSAHAPGRPLLLDNSDTVSDIAARIGLARDATVVVELPLYGAAVLLQKLKGLTDG